MTILYVGARLEKWMVEMLKIHGPGLGCIEAWDPACVVGFPLWVRGSEIIYDFDVGKGLFVYQFIVTVFISLVWFIF